MKTFGIAIRPGSQEVISLAQEIAEWVAMRGDSLVGSHELSELCKISLSQKVSDQQLAAIADPIITLGGDGTLIGIARHSGRSHRDLSKGGLKNDSSDLKNAPVLLGVNFGTLGFLTEIAPDGCIATLEDLMRDEAHLGKREMILAEVYRGEQRVFSCQAVNEALIQKGTRERLLRLDITADKQPVIQLKGDGIIFSTPTGSTAYSLAAGGSIVHPKLSVILLSPVCPHSLTARPLILPGESNIAVDIPAEYEGEVFLLVDGQESYELLPNDKVTIKRSPNSVTFVQSKTDSYFDILRTKLRWGMRNAENDK